MVRPRGDIMADPRADESIADLIREAIGEAKDWLKAEVALARAQVIKTLGDYAGAAVAWVLAALLALLGLVYVGLALVILLSPYLGEGGAAAAMGLVLLAAAAAAFLYGRAKFLRARIVPSRIAAMLAPDDTGDGRSGR